MKDILQENDVKMRIAKIKRNLQALEHKERIFLRSKWIHFFILKYYHSQIDISLTVYLVNIFIQYYFKSLEFHQKRAR